MSEVSQNEVKSISKLLTKTAEIAEQASITGVFGDGARRCIQQYNASVARLETLASIPPGFFLPLAETASLGEAGIACAQLAAYLGADSDSEGGNRAPKFIIGSTQSGRSKEEQQELKDIREILQKLTDKKDQGSNS